jgi:Zn finger protein HypA/HybF involved in hydrogenase expression
MKLAHCPACGGLVEFHVASSLVTICEHCHSAIARGDKALEDVGKVADLVDSQSPLQMGLQGNYRGKNYEIVGRVQYQHPAGGVWDEWYMAFGGDRWGWLAEAQGRFYVTFEVPLRSSIGVPAFDELDAGQAYNLGKIGVLKVGERNQAVAASAQGEIPWQFKPGASLRFADLYGPHAQFATLDYSDAEPRIYVGAEVSIDELGLSKSAFAEQKPPKEVKGLQLNCPKCGGALELHAPDSAQRVACPYCGSLLDVEQGNLRYLSTLKPSRIAPLIPLGTTGTFA